MAKSRLLSYPVVKDFDVFRDLVFGLFPGSESAVMYQFSLQGTPTAFYRRVVPAVPFATH